MVRCTAAEAEEAATSEEAVAAQIPTLAATMQEEVAAGRHTPMQH
jgi:hypothetical protein